MKIMILLSLKKILWGTKRKYLDLTNSVKFDIMYVSKDFLMSNLFGSHTFFHKTIFVIFMKTSHILYIQCFIFTSIKNLIM